MDITSFKEIFDPLLIHHLESKQDSYEKITSNTTVLATLSHIQKVSTGGKRLRPFIVWALYASQKKEADIKDIAPLLIAIELFHVFCLIHDDIMDEAPVRHSTPTIHTYTTNTLLHTRNTQNLARAGESQAILAGDILFNQVYELLHKDTWLTSDIREEIRNVFTILVDEVCLGQMLDIDLTTKREVSIKDIEEKNRLKTAYYSFARPLHIGALIAGRKDLIDTAIQFGECVGNVFQVQDDLLDIIGDEKNTKKEVLADITKNQHTILTEYIRTQAPSHHKETLDTFCGMPKENINNKDVVTLFEESGAIAYAKQYIQDHMTQAQQIITHAQLADEDTYVFNTILSLLHHRTS